MRARPATFTSVHAPNIFEQHMTNGAPPDARTALFIARARPLSAPKTTNPLSALAVDMLARCLAAIAVLVVVPRVLQLMAEHEGAAAVLARYEDVSALAQLVGFGSVFALATVLLTAVSRY